MSYQIGQYSFNNTPWMQNYMPTFDMNNCWNNFCSPMFNFLDQTWNSSSISSSTKDTTSGKYETLEQRAGRIKKRFTEISELNNKKDECQKSINEIDAEVQEIKKGTQKDGSSNVEDKRKLKDLSFWQKAGKVGMGILTGTMNVAKSLVGFDKDGKWSLKKCLKNVAIGAAVATLCVFAAPVGAGLAAALGGGAIASAVGATIAATPTILTTLGLVGGLFGAGKGVYKACKSETVQDLNNASQEIGSGLTIALASKAGLKKMSAAGGFTKADGGFLGLKNIFVNPWKTSNANYTQVAEAMSKSGFGGFKNFIFGCKYSQRMAKNNAVEKSKNDFENEMSKRLSKLEKQVDEVHAKVNNSTGAEKQIAEAELEARMSNFFKLSEAKNKADWQNICVKNEKVSIADKFRMSAEDRAVYRALRKANKDYNEAVSELKTLKFKTMKNMLGNKKYKNEIQDFGYNNNNWFDNIKNQFDCFRLGITKSKIRGSLVNLGFIAMEPSWAIVGPAQKYTATPFGFANVVGQTFDPIHESTTEQISAEEVKTLTAELNAQKEQIQKEIDSINKKVTELRRA